MEEEEQSTAVVSFHEMGLDDRILKAISELGWESPTLIQEKAIPLALEGRDVLARARTGSGKTGAYAVPLIQRVLKIKQTSRKQETVALVLTPSKELCHQAHRNISELSRCCASEVRCVDVSAQVPLSAQKPVLAEKPDVVVGPPSRILRHIVSGNLEVGASLQFLVIDEADLLFSFGHEEDMKALMSKLPSVYQAFVMSATLSEEVRTLKRLVLHNPVTLKLEESQLPDTSQLSQYHINCEEEDKFVLMYALLKLRLVRGKSLIFVRDVDRCYRLKLFLHQFGIRACVLNSELPVNSRCHIVQQFNSGLYDNIIASDEQAPEFSVESSTGADDTKEKKKKGKKGRGKRKSDREYGVARGIDFENVSNVINFDFPPSIDAYIHRVGRTARGECKGTALSLVSEKETAVLDQVQAALKDSTQGGEAVFKPFNFKMNEIDGFRYRARDAMRAVTSVAVRETRIKEIRAEVLQSEKLKTYFEDNPRDLEVLRHDKLSGHDIKLPPHLKDVPDYMVPETLRHLRSGKAVGGKRRGAWRPRGKKQSADPLQSFQFKGLETGKRQKTDHD